MQNRLKERIADLCSPLTKIKSVKGILVYGSAVKKGIQKGHDIDLLVIFDDTCKDDGMEKINFFINLITLKAKKQELILHFQPPKPLSLFWKLLHKAEPWLISALRNSIVLYDPTELLKVTKKLIASGKLYSIDEKAERLMARAIEEFIEVRKILMKAPWILLDTMTIAGQIMLSYLGIFTTSANETKKMLEKNKEKLGLSNAYIDFYDDLIKINEKIAKGTLSEFTAVEIDKYTFKVKAFIKESENILLNLEKETEKRSIKEAYDYAIKICERALTRLGKVPKNDKEKIELFKKYFVDTKKVKAIHYKTLEELYNYVKGKGKKKPKYVDKVYLKTMEIAINKLLKK